MPLRRSTTRKAPGTFSWSANTRKTTFLNVCITWICRKMRWQRVTHTLRCHGVDNGLLNVMIEVRNDLFSTGLLRAAMAQRLAKSIGSGLNRVNSDLQGLVAA